MQGAIPQYTGTQVLRIFHRDEARLFLGAAFTTVGIISGAFSLLRRRLDPLLLWLALFAILYGNRLWIQMGLMSLMVPDSAFFRDLRVAVNYAVPIPAVFFFDAAGFLGRWGKVSCYVLTGFFLALTVGTFVFGPLGIIDKANNAVIIAGFLVLIALTIMRREASRDFVIIRRGLMVFAAFVLYDNIVQAFNRPSKTEPYGFVVFLGCLGYVAARQTLDREAKLGEIEKELDVARRIQRSILPAAFPPSADFRVAARYVPMTSVAGDFYDFLVGDDGQAGLLIADVSGHGVPAALIASMVKLAATSQRAQAHDPAELLTGMNATLLGNTQEQFVTAAYVYLNSQTGELRYSAAGHPPMMILRDGEVVEVEENGLMLAAFSFSSYGNAILPLKPGDRLLLYTDGILEARNARQEEFGRQRLRALLRECAGQTLGATADLVLSRVQEWAVSQEDDLTVLVCDYGSRVEQDEGPVTEIGS
jgi:sigma-B regulation protein RsbU (phosphoserine phosphatase)